MECCDGRQWPMSHWISADNKGAAVDLEAVQTAWQYPFESSCLFPFEGATDLPRGAVVPTHERTRWRTKN
jgi:hypothetical protein